MGGSEKNGRGLPYFLKVNSRCFTKVNFMTKFKTDDIVYNEITKRLYKVGVVDELAETMHVTDLTPICRLGYIAVYEDRYYGIKVLSFNFCRHASDEEKASILKDRLAKADKLDYTEWTMF